MWPAVRQIFARWSAQFEGRVPFMYLDQAKDKDGKPAPIVTTAVGNAMLTVADAQRLPWKRSDGSRASATEIADAYAAVKGRVDLAPHGGLAFEHVTTLRLSSADIDAIVNAELTSKEAALLPSFPFFSGWPADAQLVLFSMAWALGVARLLHEFPKFCQAMRKEDFRLASTEAHIKEAGNPGIVPRNDANLRLLQNAAFVADRGLDRAMLLEELPDIPKPNGGGGGSRGGGGGGGSRGGGGLVAGALLIGLVGVATYFATRST